MGSTLALLACGPAPGGHPSSRPPSLAVGAVCRLPALACTPVTPTPLSTATAEAVHAQAWLPGCAPPPLWHAPLLNPVNPEPLPRSLAPSLA